MSQSPQPAASLSFGPFRLYPAKRQLERAGVALPLGSRALSILIVLVEHAGEVVDKNTLFKRVWGNAHAGDGALRVHLAGLRKALGDGKEGARYVTNVLGLGYSFVAPVTIEADLAQPLRPSASQQELSSRMPAPLSRMLGRDGIIPILLAQLLERRCVTLTGPGGIGKTSVAVSIGHTLSAEFAGRVCFIDLGAVSDPGLIPGAVATSLGLRIQGDEILHAIIQLLAGQRILLVIDNCEHLVEAAAALVEQLVGRVPGVHVLATSREALRVRCETVHRLSPLDTPVSDSSFAEIGLSPAVQLFLERAAASGGPLEPDEEMAPVIAGICNRLEGIPLAIELAAGLVGVLGARGVAELLDDSRFDLLRQKGLRTAPPRQQTLNALLGWSYDLLPLHERLVLRRLSVFVGAFSLQDAQTVVADENMDSPDVCGALLSLAAKSLLGTALGGDGTTSYRLLETTRAYSRGRLIESSEQEAIARRHALYVVQSLESASRAIAGSPKIESRGSCAADLGNVRAALRWSMSDSGDVSIGVRLSCCAVPLFLKLSLLSEGRHWSKQALTVLDEGSRGTGREVILQEAFAISGMFTQGNGEDVRAAIVRGLEVAEALDDGHSRLRLLAGLNMFLTGIGDCQGAVSVAELSRIAAIRRADPALIRMSEWMLGVAHHLVGNQVLAQQHCEAGLKSATTASRLESRCFGYVHRIRGMTAFARALWIRGCADQGLRVATNVLEEASRLDQPVDLCLSHIYGANVFLWRGDHAAAAKIIEDLLTHSEGYALVSYHAVAVALRGVLSIAAGDAESGVFALRGAMETLENEQQHILGGVFATALAQGLLAIGNIDEALETIEVAVGKSMQQGALFDMPEMLRVKGALLASAPGADLRRSEQCLAQSRELARTQSALGWELRTATTRFQLALERGQLSQALPELSQVYSRFTEGHGTADLKLARQLLNEATDRVPVHSRARYRQPLETVVGVVRGVKNS
jgi:predicted ATPase/DNA-binding winged helix-turn-helix (wHTH) protein